MDPVRSLYYIGSRMGHVTMFYTYWILDKAPRTKETLSDFVKIMDLGKWNITMWYWVTRYPRVFSRLTVVGQRTRVLGLHTIRSVEAPRNNPQLLVSPLKPSIVQFPQPLLKLTRSNIFSKNCTLPLFLH